MITKLLIFLGYRSSCCKAATFEPIAWNRIYCSKCKERLVLKWWYRSMGVITTILFLIAVGVMIFLEV